MRGPVTGVIWFKSGTIVSWMAALFRKPGLQAKSCRCRSSKMRMRNADKNINAPVPLVKQNISGGR